MDEDDDSLSTGALIGLAIGIAIVVAIVGLAIIAIFKYMGKP